MKTLKQFLEAKGITQDVFDGYSAEKKAELFNEMNEENAKAFKALNENVESTKEEIAKARQELTDLQTEQMKTLNEAMKELGLEIKALSESRKTGKEAVKTVREYLEENKSNIEALKDGKKGGEFQFKVVGTMLESTNISGGNVPVEQRIAGFNTIPSRRVRLLDLFTKGRASSNVISWVYQANKDGAAGGTDEGVTKNQIDFDLVVASEKVVKRTAFIKVSTEMLDDIDFIESEIRNELMRELLKDVEGTAYYGDGTPPNLRGVRTVASAFASGTFANTVENANNVDVLVVAMNQIKIAEQGDPNYILMHPSDVTALKLYKVSSSDRRYVDRLITVGSSLTLDGVPIIETTLVSQGEYLVGDFTLSVLYEKDGIMITMGLDGNDLTKNLRTLIAEWRGALIVKNNDRSAFVKGVFATDAAAIQAT